LRRNCLLQRVTEGKIQGGIEVTGRQGRRRAVVIVISLSNISGDYISIGHDHLHPRRHIRAVNIHYNPSITGVVL